jgi:serine/threonine protein kinase
MACIEIDLVLASSRHSNKASGWCTLNDVSHCGCDAERVFVYIENYHRVTTTPKVSSYPDMAGSEIIEQTIADRYKLTRRIGDGTFGEVLLAKKFDTGDRVAIKR